jgi:hypothetical protein
MGESDYNPEQFLETDQFNLITARLDMLDTSGLRKYMEYEQKHRNREQVLRYIVRQTET